MAELLTGTYEDIPRYYTAIAEWISCMLFCFFYRRKIKKSCFAGIAVGMLVLQTGWLMLTGNVSTLFWICGCQSCRTVQRALLLHESVSGGRIYGFPGMAAGIFCLQGKD